MLGVGLGSRKAILWNVGRQIDHCTQRRLLTKSLGSKSCLSNGRLVSGRNECRGLDCCLNPTPEMENPKLWAALPAADESVDVPASDKEEAREEPRLLRIPVKLSDNFIPGNSNVKLIIGQLDLTILFSSNCSELVLFGVLDYTCIIFDCTSFNIGPKCYFCCDKICVCVLWAPVS